MAKSLVSCFFWTHGVVHIHCSQKNLCLQVQQFHQVHLSCIYFENVLSIIKFIILVYFPPSFDTAGWMTETAFGS